MAIKSNLRSFRYSDRVAEILEKFKGNTLNEKFENLVLYCFDEVSKREKRLNEIDKEISKKLDMLRNFDRQLSELRGLEQSISSAKHYLGIVSRGAALVADRMEADAADAKKTSVTQNVPAANVPGKAKRVTEKTA